MKPFLKNALSLLAIGLGAGFLNGLLGAGGGILILLGLRLLMGKGISDPHTFFASTLAVMLPLSLVSAFFYFREGHLAEAAFSPIILPAVAGGALGAFLLPHLSVKLLNKIFAAVILVSGLVMVF